MSAQPVGVYNDHWAYRRFMHDEASLPHALMNDRVFAPHALSRNMAKTPEGYLMCRNVGLARVGDMEYGPREVPDVMWSSAAKDGRITIRRFAEDVFSQQFMDSLVGKSVVVTHPVADVNPENWKQHEVGVVLNARRGEGVDADLIVGDLLIKDAGAIKYVEDEKPEVSVGYEADYQEYESNKWKQIPLVANHVALVDAGRCGATCSIRDNTGDAAMKTRDSKHNTRDKYWFNDWRLRLDAAYKAGDAAAIQRVQDEAAPGEPDGDDDVHIHLDDAGAGEGSARLDNLEGRVNAHDALHEEHSAGLQEIRDHLGISKDANEETESGMLEEAPPDTTMDAVRLARDSALLADSFQAVRAAAEILSPGVQLLTYDAKLPPRKTYDAICSMRRKALDRANLTPEGRELIESVTGGRPLVLDGMKCGTVRTLFNSVAALAKAHNASKVALTAHDAAKGKAADGPKRLMTAKDINEFNRKHYGQPTH